MLPLVVPQGLPLPLLVLLGLVLRWPVWVGIGLDNCLVPPRNTQQSKM
jgi:hypothetical protein